MNQAQGTPVMIAVILWFAAALAFTVAVACLLVPFPGPWANQPWVASGVLAGGGVLLVLLRRSRYRAVQEWTALTVSTVVLLEIGLQTAAWSGVLPGLNISNHVPHGRCYTTKEGRGNSINNRYGWFHSRSEFGQAEVRVGLIGDSFVRAIHVDRDQTMGGQLDRLLHANPDRPGAALSFGISGVGAPEYLELLEYANRHYAPTHLVVCLYLGNDFRSCLEMLEGDPRTTLRHSLDSDGVLTRDPESLTFQNRFRERLDGRHLGMRAHLTEAVQSHFMLYVVARAIRWGLMHQAFAPHPPRNDRPEDRFPSDGWAILGLNPLGFEIELSAEALHARELMKGFLREYQRFGRDHGLEVSIVSIPHFSARFYETQEGTSWTAVLGDYDLLGPERYLEAVTAELGLRFLPLGRTMQEVNLSAAEIQELYLLEGRGHFSEKGHSFAAHAVYDHLLSP